MVCDAVELAYRRGLIEPGAIFHSAAAQYTSAEFRAAPRMRKAMGRVGSRYHKAVAESFFASMKAEIGIRMWPNRAGARQAVFAGLNHDDPRRSTFDIQPSQPIQNPRLLPPARRPLGMEPRCPVPGWNLKEHHDLDQGVTRTADHTSGETTLTVGILTTRAAAGTPSEASTTS